jgi:hypothetical protein
MDPRLHHAVVRAVDVVNSHSGHTTVHLRFAEDLADVDFVANSAKLHGVTFEFQAGFETYGGSVDELSEIKTEVIGH